MNITHALIIINLGIQKNRNNSLKKKSPKFQSPMEKDCSHFHTFQL